MDQIIKPTITDKSVIRTRTAHLKRVYYEDGRSWAEASLDGWSTTQCVPPNGKHTFMNPVLHRHTYQVEFFEVLSGQGMWTLHKGGWLRDEVQQIHLKAGDKITIPKAAAHRFENTSGDENLVIRASYNPEDFALEEQFFRNVFGYFDDCRKAGVDASLFQASRYAYTMAMPICISPGPEWIAKWVDHGMLVLFGKVVGHWILGYPASYPEYFDNTKSK